MNKIKYSIFALLCLLVLQLTVAFGQDEGCPPIIELDKENHNFSSEIWAEDKIESVDGIIQPNVNVVFKAGNEVILKDGFKALEGSTFRAFNENVACSNVSFSSNNGDCEVVNHDPILTNSDGDHNLVFYTTLRREDPKVKYKILNKTNGVEELREIGWERIATQQVLTNVTEDYVVYIDEDDCTPPNSEQQPQNQSDENCIESITESFTFSSGNGTWSKVREEGVQLVVGSTYRLRFNARLSNGGTANIGISHGNENVGYFDKRVTIENSTDFETYYVDSFVGEVNHTNTIAYALKSDPNSTLEIKDFCLILDDGDTVTPIEENCIESISESFTFSSGNGTWSKVREEGVQLVVGSTYKLKFNARLSNGGTANIGISHGNENVGYFDKRVTIENSTDFETYYVDSFVGEVNHTNTTAYALKSDPNSTLEIKDFCLILEGAGNPGENDPIPTGEECSTRTNNCGVQSNSSLACFPPESQINECHPSKWLLNDNSNNVNIEDFDTYSPDDNDDFQVGMNLGRLEYYGTMIAYKNLFKMAQQWRSSILNSINETHPCDHNILHISDIINADPEDLEINGLRAEHDFGVPNKLTYNFFKQHFSVENPITFDINGYPNVDLPANNIIIRNNRDNKSKTFNNVTVKSILLNFNRKNWQVEPNTDLFGNANGGLNIGGEYTIFFDGEGKIKVNDIVVDDNDSKLNSTGIFTALPEGSIKLEIIESKARDNVRNIRIYKNHHANDDNNGKHDFLNGVTFSDTDGTIPEEEGKFYDAFIDRLGDFPILRFMNWNRINHSTHRNPSDSDLNLGINDLDNYYSYAIDVNPVKSDVSCFAEFVNSEHYITDLRPPAGSDPGFTVANQNQQRTDTYMQYPNLKQRGAPYRDIIEIYKAIKKKKGKKALWINVPHNASDPYIEKMAELFATKLNGEGIDIYLEYSNEVWNTSFKQNFDLRRDISITHCPMPDTESGIPKALRSYVTKSKNAFNIFKTIFESQGGNLNLKRVVAAQHGNPHTVSQILRSFLPGEFEVLSVGGYIHPFIDKDGNGNVIGGPGSSLNNNSDADDIANATILAMQQRWEGKLMQCKRMADCFGAELILYEGGQHFTRNQLRGNEAISSQTIVTEQTMLDFDDSQQMRNLYNYWFCFLKNKAEIDGILAYSLATAPETTHGSWGHIKHTFQNPATSNKYQALMDFKEGTNTGVCCQTPFVEQPNTCPPAKIKADWIGSFAVYPNPFANNLTLQTETENGQMRILDMAGRTLLQQEVESNTTIINTKTLKPGYYLVEVENGGKTQTQKIIKY